MTSPPADPDRQDQERPVDPTPRHTGELPPTPQRDRTILASAWIEAPEALRQLGEDIIQPEPSFKRRIGRWLLWRSGPPSRGHARYMALAADDLTQRYSFRLYPDGSGKGDGPSGRHHTRFRAWKEDLRDHGGPKAGPDVDEGEGQGPAIEVG